MAYISQLKVNNTTYDIKAATCSGNAATATKATQDGSGNTITSTYLKLAGGTMTGPVLFGKTGGMWVSGKTQANSMLQWTVAGTRNGSRYDPIMWGQDVDGNVWNLGVAAGGGIGFFGFKAGRTENGTDGQLVFDQGTGWTSATRVYGAVWNDYAEYRTYNDGETPYGKVVCENGDDSVSLSTKRMQLGAMICSDTYGTCMGDENNGIPIAVAGRTLAYPFENREEYRNHIGEAVCAGPNGTVSLMTEEETLKYPNAIVGYVSAVPDYETWSTNNVAVNGRVWIKIK